MENEELISTTLVSISKHIANTFRHLEKGEFELASKNFYEMAETDAVSYLPKQALLNFAMACKEQNWNILSDIFIRNESANNTNNLR